MNENKNTDQHKKELSRRDFMGGAAAIATAFTFVPGSVLAGSRRVPPNEKINIGCIPRFRWNMTGRCWKF